METIAVAALDKTLAELGERPWGVDKRGFTRFVSLFYGDLSDIFPEAIAPFANRSTYSHVVEMSVTGPIRIETQFVLGQSGNVTGSGFPIVDPLNFSIMPFYNTFTYRPFPLFD